MYSEFADMKEQQKHMTAQIQQLQPSSFVHHNQQAPASTSFRERYDRNRGRAHLDDYRPGKGNSDADALSRLPKSDNTDTEELTTDLVSAICNKVQVSSLVETMCLDADAIGDDDSGVFDDKCHNNAKEWSSAQHRDPAIATIMDSLEAGQKPDRTQYIGNKEMTKLLKNYHHLRIKHGVLYAQAYPCKNTSAKTTADIFFNNFVSHYGLPKRIHSDKGANFVGNLMTELCKLLRIDKSSTTPYHPMGNGMCERFNRTLLNMLGTLDPESKKDWKTQVAPLVHAYNCTRHESTKHSPYFLMFGRHPRLPIDLAFGLDIEPGNTGSMLKYTESLKKRLQQAYELATEKAKTSQKKQKVNYDQRARAAILDIGDRVLVKIVAFEGRHKIADGWENDVYVVIDQPNTSVPVYLVGKENGEGRRKTLHRNLLLPIGSLQGQDISGPKQRRTLPSAPVSQTVPKLRRTLPSVSVSKTRSSRRLQGENLMIVTKNL
ncbi:uncharacterized protein LOC124268954 [Haliotis rubra]|uniref:uncharacterized protein LOC124268954 n=1 Tax=Haliotis rubra TaxID=36100 RepID=UPI001EE5E8DB|nr:uncharacterized protein LOC124268954 [Haliotis rubra]